MYMAFEICQRRLKKFFAKSSWFVRLMECGFVFRYHKASDTAASWLIGISIMVGRLLIWLVLLVLVSGAYAEERDVILVLDNAGAMKRMDAKGIAGLAVDGFVEKLKGDVRAAVVLLDRSATVFVPLIAVTDKSRLGFLETLQKLNYHGKYPDTVAALEQALREFEIHGREGAEKSIILLTGGTPDPSDTALVQSRLRALGYEVGPIDGVMGPKTRGAIRQFQRQVGMPADGKLNRTLLARLEEVYGARWQGELTAKAARAGVKVIVVALGEGSSLGQALAEKTSGEYLQIPKAEDLAGVFERLSSARSRACCAWVLPCSPASSCCSRSPG